MTELKTSCKCGGEVEFVDARPSSSLDHCTGCGTWLCISSDELNATVQLDLVVGIGVDISIEDVRNASKQLLRALENGTLPEKRVCALYGIKSEEHLRTIQTMVKAGITEHELALLAGDGHALTELAWALQHNPYGDVKIEITADELASARCRGSTQKNEQRNSHDMEF